MRRVSPTPGTRFADADRPARSWALFVLVFLCAVPLFVSIGTLSAIQARVRWVAVGAPGDAVAVGGMYAPEADGGRQWRWTSGDASLTIPLPSGSAGHRWRVDLHLTNPGSRSRTLLVHCGPVQQSIPLSASFGDLFATVDCPSRGDSITLRMNVDTVRLPADGRALGVAIRSVNVGALDTDVRWQWRLRIALGLAALLTGSLAAMYAVGSRVGALVVPVGLFAASLVVFAADSPWGNALAAPRPALLALATGMLAYLLAYPAHERRTRLAVLVLTALLPLTALLVPDPALTLIAVKPWTLFDADARALLPWLCVALGVAGTALGGVRAPLLAATACAVAVSTNVAMPILGVVTQHWSATLVLPDWSAPVSVVGSLLFAALVGGLLTGVYVAQRSPRSIGVRVIVLLAVALTVLVPWRVQTMLLNGDEPHYAVIARSLADDADLDPLDDYASAAYRTSVYSPDGNIAADRGDGVDRAAAVWAPTGADGWLLLPPSELAQPFTDGDKGQPALRRSNSSLIVRSPAGHLDALPPLVAATELALTLPTLGTCDASTLLVASVDGALARPDVQITRMHSDGSSSPLPALTWQDGVGRVDLPRSELKTDCRGGAFGLVIAANAPVVAELLAHGERLLVVPATPASANWQLGPLPRDPLGDAATTAQLAVLNPERAAAIVTIRLHSASADVAVEQQIHLEAGEVARLTLPQGAGSAVSVEATAPVVATLVGWLPAGAYVAPQLHPLTAWDVPVQVPSDRLAGADLVALSVDETGTFTTVTVAASLCAGCAQTLPVRAPTALSASAGTVLVGGVQVEERSDGLHYDLLLPTLAAAPLLFDFPWGALMVPAVSGVLLALGLLWLLQREGRRQHWPDHAPLVGSLAVVLLAPLSPFLVRLFTEPVAAALLVGAVAALALVHDPNTKHRWLAASGVALVAALLPILHGRYLPLAGMLLALLLWEMTRGRRRLLLLTLPAAALGLLLLALSPFAVALQERGSPSYLSTEWLPHNLVGMLLDRGSGLLVWAPWCLLALACPPRSLSQTQRHALLLIATQASITMLRAGGWQTFSPPARYLLPVVPLLALFAVPGALRLWRARNRSGRVVVVALCGLSVATTTLLLWVPQVGYALPPVYPVDAFADEMPLAQLFALAPRVSPGTSHNVLGGALLLACWLTVAHLLRSRQSQNPRTNAEFHEKSH